MTQALLELRGLCVRIGTERVVHQLSLSIGRGQALGLVGESGCGKSTAALSVLQLLPPGAILEAGEVRFDGQRIDGLGEAQLRALRGRRIGFLLQESMMALNPVLRIGEQISEVLEVHQLGSPSERKARALAQLRQVGLESSADAYPHMLSGGMRQRVAMAMALVGEPELLIADEPTRGLDPMMQSQVVQWLGALQRERGLAVLFISHDLALVSQVCDQVAVMFSGTVVEQAPARALVQQPAHPYTEALRAAIPGGAPREPLPVPHRSLDRPLRDSGCAYRGRCPRAMPRCQTQIPELTSFRETRQVACFEPRLESLAS